MRREEGLQVPPPKPRQRRQGLSNRTAPESAVPQSCVVLGLHERLYAARRQAACLQPDRRIHREMPRIDADRAIRATDVLEILAEAIRQHGTPRYIRSDNGPSSSPRPIQLWLTEHQIKAIYIDPGCPWQNGYAESFNSRFRVECLDRELLYTLSEARYVFDQWRKYYNETRPHRSLGRLTPGAFAKVAQDEGVDSSRATPSFRRHLHRKTSTIRKPSHIIRT